MQDYKGCAIITQYLRQVLSSGTEQSAAASVLLFRRGFAVFAVLFCEFGRGLRLRSVLCAVSAFIGRGLFAQDIRKKEVNLSFPKSGKRTLMPCGEKSINRRA